MGEAMLVRRGGGGAGKLTMVAAPAQTQYYVGETFDKTGLIVGADFGTYTLPIDASAVTITPDRPLTASDTSVAASVRVGTRTLTLNVPVTVSNFSSTLNNCSWADIARAAALGVAASTWRVGDTKYTDYNGTNIAFRIIGFGYDDLAPTDARYNDSTYNGGLNKAAITFQAAWTNSSSGFNRDTMNRADSSSGGWTDSFMRVGVLPADLELLGEDVKRVVRTVSKTTGNNVVTADRLFLPNRKEYEGDSAYPYYANGGHVPYNTAPAGTNPLVWTREPTGSTFVGIDAFEKYVGSVKANTKQWYYPAFCI